MLLILKVVGSIALLIYGMKMMSEGLQKMAGSQLRHALGTMTRNRFTGLLTGTFVTAAVQSSTATTVMTVSFVNAGLLSLAQAISVIMGANIGTTLTAWIMSAGFSFNVTNVVWPALFIAILLTYSKKYKTFGEFLFGMAFLFLGLGTLRENAMEMDLGHNEAVLNFFQTTGSWGYGTYFLFLLLGGVLTMCAQSSAAVMAITMILCSSGALGIEAGIALVLGENIGTTVTSNLAAMTANPNARRAALAHMLFNIFGVCWVLCVFPYFVAGVCHLVQVDPHADGFDPIRLSVVLAAFHTSFNLCNVLLLIWFIKPIERFVTRLIPGRAETEEDDARLKFISAGLMQTPELSVFEAQKEITTFGARMLKMYGYVCQLLTLKDQKEHDKLFEKILKYEQISDNMEIEIAKYLDGVSDAHLSDETKAKIRIMLREISELESIGDCCFNIARSIHRRRAGEEDFTEVQYERIHQMMRLTETALQHMQTLLSGRKSAFNVQPSWRLEEEINAFREQLRSQNITDVDAHLYTYGIGTMYMDIINECERLGDFVVNVIEARTNTKHEQ